MLLLFSFVRLTVWLTVWVAFAASRSETLILHHKKAGNLLGSKQKRNNIQEKLPRLFPSSISIALRVSFEGVQV